MLKDKKVGTLTISFATRIAADGELNYCEIKKYDAIIGLTKPQAISLMNELKRKLA